MNKKYIFFILLSTIGNLFCESIISENGQDSNIKEELLTSTTKMEHILEKQTQSLNAALENAMVLKEQTAHINQLIEDLQSKERLLVNGITIIALCTSAGLTMEYITSNNKSIDTSKKLAIYGLTCIGIASAMAIRDIHASHDLKEQQKSLVKSISQATG